jgi:hypothetical protein
MTTWTKIWCWACGGHGLVSAYTADGGDFTGAEECDICDGSDRAACCQVAGRPVRGARG